MIRQRPGPFPDDRVVRIRPVADRVHPGEQRLPGGGADAGRRVEAGELHPLRGQPVDVRRPGVGRAAEAGDVVPAHVVGDEEDDIGPGVLGGRGRGGGSGHRAGGCQGEDHRLHRSTSMGRRIRSPSRRLGRGDRSQAYGASRCRENARRALGRRSRRADPGATALGPTATHTSTRHISCSDKRRHAGRRGPVDFRDHRKRSNTIGGPSWRPRSRGPRLDRRRRRPAAVRRRRPRRQRPGRRPPPRRRPRAAPSPTTRRATPITIGSSVAGSRSVAARPRRSRGPARRTTRPASSGSTSPAIPARDPQGHLLGRLLRQVRRERPGLPLPEADRRRLDQPLLQVHQHGRRRPLPRRGRPSAEAEGPAPTRRRPKGGHKARTTTSHRVIRRWAEERGGTPSTVKGTRKKNDPAGILRIDFPGYSGEGTLKAIPWDDFFAKFDEITSSSSTRTRPPTARSAASASSSTWATSDRPFTPDCSPSPRRASSRLPPASHPGGRQEPARHLLRLPVSCSLP